MKSQTIYAAPTAIELEKTARDLAHSLGITLFIREGKIHQNGPGQEIIPPTVSKATSHGGRFEIARTSTVIGS